MSRATASRAPTGPPTARHRCRSLSSAPDALDEAAKGSNSKTSGSSVSLAAPAPTAPSDPKKDEVQGVFVINGKKAEFRQVDTGISGVTDIEVTKGLQPGDEIVVGSYKALRTLKPNAQIKVDNSAPKKTDDQQS